jgi:hypothetical protein
MLFITYNFSFVNLFSGNIAVKNRYKYLFFKTF